MVVSVVSMTGYGAASRAWDAPGRGRVRVDVEVRSVNGRFLEVKLRQPFGSTVEPVLRSVVERHVGRGRVDASVFVRKDPEQVASDPLAGLGIDAERVAMVAAAAADVAELALQKGVEVQPPTALDLLRFAAGSKGDPGAQAPVVPPFIEALVEDALVELVGFRRREGSALEETLRSLAEDLSTRAKTLAAQLPSEAERIQERVAARLAELTARAGSPQVEPARVAQEVAVVLTRGDVAEELARIDSHLSQLRETLDADASVGQGKTLDFVTQELHREFTTMGSKLTSHEGSRMVIEAKAIIERIREQVQNVE